MSGLICESFSIDSPRRAEGGLGRHVAGGIRRAAWRGCLGIAALLSAAGPALGDIIEDMNIRTWTHVFSGWNMEDNQYRNLIAQLPAEVQVDKILDVQVHIYSDGSTPEVFNLSRLANQSSSINAPNVQAARSGGWADVQVASDRWITIWLDRGPCTRRSGEECTPSNVHSFFAAKSVPVGSALRQSQTFLKAYSRSFFFENVPRGVIKIDYACTSCGNPSTHVFWKKIGPWNMASGSSRAFNPSEVIANSASIVDMSATIHSDYMSQVGGIIVDDLEHQGARQTMLGNDEYPRIRGRGGFLWFGKGCLEQAPHGCKYGGISNQANFYRLYSGPSKDGANGTPSSYRSGYFIYGGTNQSVSYDSEAPGSNRGWLRVEYTGTKSSTNIPFAFKSKAAPLEGWSMTDNAGHSIGFSQFGVAANRVGRITTTIRSNLGTISGNYTYYLYSNLFRPNFTAGKFETPSDFQAKGGGLSYIDEGRNLVVLKHGASIQTTYPSYFNNSQYAGTADRGYVLLDYLAGSCETGPSGFKIQAVPGTQVGDCTGSSQPFVIQGAGRGTLNNASTDSLTYVYKTSTATNLTVTVRVDGQVDANAYGLAGVMFRASLNEKSRNAAAVTTPTGTNLTYFRRRLTDNTGTQVTTATNTTARWLRIKKAGNVFRAYYSTNPSNTMPASFTEFANSPQTISFPTSPTPYYVGLQVSNLTSPNLNRVTFSGYSETIP